MKTGLITADPRKVCWKTYLYHGIIMRCRVSCEPGPWWYGNLNPWFPPPSVCYEANVLPPANPDYPMVLYDSDGVPIEFISGGLYIVRCGSWHSATLGYRFISVPRAYNELHMRASAPYWNIGCANTRPTGQVTFWILGDISFYVQFYKDCVLPNNVTAYLRFHRSGCVDRKVPFSTDMALDVIRRPSSNYWDFYLNGVLVYSYPFRSFYMDRFEITDWWTGVEVGLDYFRIYVDKSADA